MHCQKNWCSKCNGTILSGLIKYLSFKNEYWKTLVLGHIIVASYKCPSMKIVTAAVLS